ncbi:hypothetical protein PUN28_006544 [Cardiocondyla obscurior]|uniref:Uncharacterized protein n=1 Tax=Cardiocondyla obscurior TaxID=286306 RepID=A0AAW2GBP9_9HYME
MYVNCTVPQFHLCEAFTRPKSLLPIVKIHQPLLAVRHRYIPSKRARERELSRSRIISVPMKFRDLRREISQDSSQFSRGISSFRYSGYRFSK